jgi:hypothetical protein
MAYPVDPMRTKYWPEVFGEAGYVLTTESGTEIASYSSYGDYIAQIVTLGTDPEATGPGTIRVNNDSGSNLINSSSTARYYMDRHEDLKVNGIESLSLYGYFPSGGGAANLRYRYGLRVTKPTVYEKLLLKMSLTDAEEALNTKFAISKKINAGILSGQTTQQYTKIYEVAKTFASLADVNPTIGQEIHPLAGEKAVLLGIAVDGWANADEVFINVTRDGEQVMRMDAYAFLDSVGAGAYDAESNYEIPLHVVAIDKLKVWVENTVTLAVTNLNVRFKYGIAPLTIIEKIRWGLPITDEENAIAMEFDLVDSVVAGVT